MESTETMITPVDYPDSQTIEIRAFNFLKTVFDERKWPFPYLIKLNHECSAADLARMLDLPVDKIEAVFINGSAKPLADGQVKPGDRVAFVPHGTPGPYRVLLGFVKLPGEQQQ